MAGMWQLECLAEFEEAERSKQEREIRGQTLNSGLVEFVVCLRISKNFYCPAGRGAFMGMTSIPPSPSRGLSQFI